MDKNILLLNEKIDKQEIQYLPNNPTNLGASVSIHNTVISVGYGYGLDFTRDKRLGKTESFDFQLHNYGRKFLFDIFVQQYKGFYVEEPEVVLYPDLEVIQYGVNAQYVFDGKRFSYKAAFDQNEIQRRSCGSFTVGGGVYYNKIKNGSILHKNGVLKSFQISATGGYAYTWVINRHWYVSGSGSTGLSWSNESFRTIGHEDVKIYPTFFTRVAAGYNHDRWSLGINFVGNFLFNAISDESSVQTFSGKVRFVYTIRFASVPLLKKGKFLPAL